MRMMCHRSVSWLRAFFALMLSLALVVQPAAAQSVLRDTETEDLLNDMARPLSIAAGLEPRNVQMILLQDDSINAFVAGGQAVYIHSGLITAADSANQVQGVIAHELGHVTGGHIVRFGEGAKAATGISVLSLILGAAAIAMGGGEAGMAVMSAGQQAAMGRFLSFSRTQESSADAAGAQFLSKAGISGKGSIEFFQKLKREEFRLSPSSGDIDPYARTHPMSGDRIATLLDGYRIDPAWNKPSDPALEARFARVKAKLYGYVAEPRLTLIKYPETDRSIPALYARAYAWHKAAYPDKAIEAVDALVAKLPHDPYVLELKGQILLESGKPKEALVPLREAVQRSQNAPLIASLLGHALIATEDQANFPEAERVLKTSVGRDRENPFAWYQLGLIYSRTGDQPRAALATAERYSLEGRPQLALPSAEMAMRGVPVGSPDYLRAQDIAMTSRTAMDETKNKKRR